MTFFEPITHPFYPVHLSAERVKCLSLSRYNVHVYIVCRQKQLFAVLPRENCQFCQFCNSLKDAYKVGRLFCRVLWPWVSNSCTASRDIEHYGNWVCWPTTSLRERCGHSGEHARGWRKCQQAIADRLAQ